MGYTSLSACAADLERTGRLVRIDAEVDPFLELASVQRRAFRAGAPALLFTRVKGTRFPMLANLFGTRERLRFVFRDSLRALEALFRLKADPAELRHFWRYGSVPRLLWNARPRFVADGPALAGACRLGELPQLVGWPKDGGAFVTLPLVYTEAPDAPGWMRSNLGMYRVQISGGAYEKDAEAGLHYQICRGMGAHHAQALRRGEALRVRVFVGGPPALTVAAIMPLPEGISELLFAGMLGGRRISLIRRKGELPVAAEADFCISGVLAPYLKAEGPFGDHLGYYSLAHDFPVLRVESVHHRPDAIWPFTSVGRPPQEDTVFGEFIHELTAPLVPQTFAGVHEVHAVDCAGVHPLLLGIGSERYVPYAVERRPQELLACALATLGTGQTSLAKYLLMAAQEDAPGLRTRMAPDFFRHMLERTDFTRDLHFLTRAATDTLDYAGTALNEGSKLIWLAAGPRRRSLSSSVPTGLALPEGFGLPQIAAPGILLVAGPPHRGKREEADPRMEALALHLERVPGLEDALRGLPLLAVVDDATFCAANWENFVWVVFTRSDPARDIYGVGATMHCKHWGCRGPLIIDARFKAHQAPPLEEDPDVERRVDALGAPGGPLHGYV
ncbi:MAG: UbiD family decarboxylase [Deltaproteobacteria bacterium]|nr:UbiD family decarboxylase [Deltaproteobacteria bacterium]